MPAVAMGSRIAPHIVLFAFPAQSHVNGALDLSRKLAGLGVSVTFVCTEAYIAGATKQGFDASGLPFRLHRLQALSGPSQESDSKLSDSVNNLSAVVRETANMDSAFEALLQEMALAGTRVAGIVYDLVLWWVAGLGKRLGIPAYTFSPFSSAYCLFRIHIPDFASQGRLPLRPDTDLSDKSNVFVLPGFPSLHASEVPSASWEPNPICSFDVVLRGANACLRDATGLLVNSVYELEKDVVDAMREKAPAMDIKAVGPLLPSSFLRGEAERRSAERCMEWLDEQRAASVVYVAFGTIACLTQAQAMELAMGLEESNSRFLWVVRDPQAGAIDHHQDQLLVPSGFEERTRGRGMVLWTEAPQRQILSHHAIGAFLTHCGWNSMLESLCRGVPMLCYPIFGDQGINAKWVVEVLRAGKLLRRGDDGVARRDEVAAMVRAVLADTPCNLSPLR